jgi:hypothetical protein
VNTLSKVLERVEKAVKSFESELREIGEFLKMLKQAKACSTYYNYTRIIGWETSSPLLQPR